MSKYFTYKVMVEVEDDMGMPVECYNEDLFDLTDNIEDEDGSVVARFLQPEVMADIVMRERLGGDEDYGFDYTVEYENREAI
jgi:hypothetical protein